MLNAPPAGIEPATCALGKRRSIQLSYEGVAKHLTVAIHAGREVALSAANRRITLDRMSAGKPLQLVPPREYLEDELSAPIKREYVGGFVYARAERPNVHNTIAGAFLGAVGSHLRGKPCQPFNSDTKVRVRLPTQTRFYYPDGMIVCDPNPADDTFQDRPVVVAEVLSDATRRIDEGEKRDAYLTIPTLSVYLLIESDRPRVVAYGRTDAGFVPHADEGLDASIPLDEVGVTLSLAELYDRVDFTRPEPDAAE